MPEKDSLYFFVNGRYVLKGDTLMSEVYEQRKDVDGFLYITYTDETTLGTDEWGIYINKLVAILNSVKLDRAVVIHHVVFQIANQVRLFPLQTQRVAVTHVVFEQLEIPALPRELTEWTFVLNKKGATAKFWIGFLGGGFLPVPS